MTDILGRKVVTPAATDAIGFTRPEGNRVFPFQASLTALGTALAGIAQTVSAAQTFTAEAIFSVRPRLTAGLGFGTAAGAAGSMEILNVRKTGIANNTATAMITVTVPNGENNAAIFLDILGHLGTGTDLSESSRCATGCVVLARKTAAATVAVAATLTTAQIATTAGGGTLTLAYSVSAMTGAAGAQQTFTINLTLVVTGTITDHTAMVSARLLNSMGSGVTMAAA